MRDQRADRLPGYCGLPVRRGAERVVFGDHLRPAETSLGHLAGRRVRHPHRGLAALASVPLHYEGTQRWKRYRTSTGQPQFVGPGHQQTVTGESLGDPVGPRLQQVLARLANASYQIVIEGASCDDTRRTHHVSPNWLDRTLQWVDGRLLVPFHNSSPAIAGAGRAGSFWHYSVTGI